MYIFFQNNQYLSSYYLTRSADDPVSTHTQHQDISTHTQHLDISTCLLILSREKYILLLIREIYLLSTHTHQIDRFSGVSTCLNLIPNPSMLKRIIHSCSCKIYLHRYEASIDISTDLLLVLSVVSCNPQQIPGFR